MSQATHELDKSAIVAMAHEALTAFDPAAPRAVIVEIRTLDGNVLCSELAEAKIFSTGSKGYHVGTKIKNPLSGAKYQVGVTVTKTGSKDE